jgi:hypothetical protein
LSYEINADDDIILSFNGKTRICSGHAASIKEMSERIGDAFGENKIIAKEIADKIFGEN